MFTIRTICAKMLIQSTCGVQKGESEMKIVDFDEKENTAYILTEAIMCNLNGLTYKERKEKMQKHFELSYEERIEEFRKHFNSKDKYLGSEFFTWHHILTGSCLQGRNNFVKNNNLSLEDEFTVKEFIELCKNDFGGEIVKRLEDYY